MGLPVTSPDISVLDFNILFDISGAIPSITLTNASTVTNPTNLTWWYTIYTPSGLPIHVGSLGTPDVLHLAWTTLTIPANSWPTPGGYPPCAQIEFASGTPYIATLFVKDSANNTFSLAKSQAICRPSGNVQDSCSNFGQATIGVEVQCDVAKIYATDTSSYSYQNQIAPQVQTSNWILTYPPDGSGNIPDPATASNAPYVYFPIGFAGEGYNIFLNTFATYNMGNGVTIKVQYKSVQNNQKATFGVWCGIDLCKLSCAIQKLYEVTKNNCGELDSPELDSKLSRATTLFSLIMAAIMQPLCDTDVTKLRKELEKILGVGDCCCAIGINPMGNGSGGGSGSGSCCPITSNVININTGTTPVQCPNSYFPVQVYDPTGTIIIGIAYDANSLVSLLNSNSAWQAFGVAFNEGNCQVGWYAPSGTIIPVIIVGNTGTTTTCVGNTQNYVVDMTDLCLPVTPITSASFPCNAWVDFGLGTGPQPLGTVASQAALVTALNAVSGKPTSISFTAGSSVAQIHIINSSCTTYSGAISITCDAGSSSFLLYGASHIQEVSAAVAAEAVEAYGLRTNALVGKIAGLPTTHSPWHMIKLGNYMVTAEGDTGKVYFFDITNPLMPVLARTIQLSTVVAGGNGNFTNTPTSLGLGSSVVNSIYSLYFPTDTYNLMTVGSLYIFEGKTGTAWQLNMYDPGSGVTAGFQDAKLIGKCPRVMAPHISNANLAIYFTQDGTLEADIAGSSGVLEGYCVTLDLSFGFNAGSLASQQILLNQDEYVWAASFDGADTIWFLGQLGTMAQYSIASNSVTNRYSASIGTVFSSARSLVRRGNMKYSAGRLFVSSLGAFQPIGLGQGCLYVDVSTLSGTPNATLFTGNLSNPSAFAHNILPLGNCLVLVTIDANGLAPGYGVILVYTTSGVFLEACNLHANEAIYNVVPIPSLSVYTPNNLI